MSPNTDPLGDDRETSMADPPNQPSGSDQPASSQTPGTKPEPPKDTSMGDAKGVGLDFGKDLGGALWNDWFRKDRSLTSALKAWLDEGCKDAAKSAVDAMRKQA